MYYFDNAATTAQKPDVVSKAVYAALTAGDIGNPSRGPMAMPEGLRHRLDGERKDTGAISQS